jgi:hypothetical protein
MVTIGVDPHKQTHTAVAVDPLGVAVAQRTVRARPEGFGALLALHRERLLESRTRLINELRWQCHDPQTAVYIAKQPSKAKPTAKRSAASNATSYAASTTSSATQTQPQSPSA